MAMRIGIIGSGRMGRELARHLALAAHDVLIANSRGPAAVEGVAGEAAEHVRPARVDEAVQIGDVVVLAVPYPALPDVARQGAPWDDKVVVDITNNYAGRDVPDMDPGTGSSSSAVARLLPTAHVVKAFNTVWFRRLADEARPAGEPGRLAVPVAGDEQDAKELVMALVDEVGFDPVDAGTLADSKRQEPGSPVYNQPFDAAQVRAALERARA